MSPLCKIIWLREQRPELFALSAKFISIKEYIWFEFFGQYEVDYSIASGTGLFDIHNRKWFPQSLALAGITENQLSNPVSPTHTRGDLRGPLRGRLGLTKEVPFIIGASDGCLANLGSSAIHPGDLALTIGTSGAVRMVVDKPAYDEKERIFNYILTDNLYVCGGAINNGGVAVKWYIDNFFGTKEEGPMDISARLADIAAIPPGTEGLIFLPYLLGERAPIWDANAKGVFFGIYAGHTAQHFLRAVIEGICFSLYQISRCLEEMAGPVQVIYASGGFIQSQAWLQMLADIFEKPVSVTNSADASAIGAAMLGWYGQQKIANLGQVRDMIRVHHRYFPIEGNHKIYMKNYAIFAVLYEKLKDEFSELSNRQQA